LSDISVWINSIPAPILSIAFQEGYQQINFQVPWEVQGTTPPLDVEVSQYGEQSHTMNTQTNGFSVFFADANGYGLIRHASDHLLVETQNPAHPGENLIAYGINLGPVASTPPDGAVSAVEAQSLSVASFNTCYVDHSVRIETITTVPSYVGLSPGTVGVYQVDFQLPSTVSVGDLPLTIERTIWSNPFGQCLGNRSNESTQTFVSRSVLLPIQ